MNLGERILILGPPGSGKSALAVKLGESLGIPAVHLDRLFWKPGWVETPRDEMDGRAAEAASGERWIIDGNYTNAAFDLRLARADSIVFLDFGRRLCLYRVVKRRVQNRGKTRRDMGEGCPEKIDCDFLKWIWNFPKRQRKNILEKIYNSGKAVYHVKTRKEALRFANEAAKQTKERNDGRL
jgi:adenylate kinase family enzyme